MIATHVLGCLLFGMFIHVIYPAWLYLVFFCIQFSVPVGSMNSIQLCFHNKSVIFFGVLAVEGLFLKARGDFSSKDGVMCKYHTSFLLPILCLCSLNSSDLFPYLLFLTFLILKPGLIECVFWHVQGFQQGEFCYWPCEVELWMLQLSSDSRRTW